jgi:hypothetical protein
LPVLAAQGATARGFKLDEAMQRFICIYCGSGPYRHVRSLVESGAEWFPWGYRVRGEDALEITIAHGDEVELWEINDTRDAHYARPVVVANVDYVSRAAGYLALTLRPDAGLSPVAARADVVAQAAGRRFIASSETQRRVAPASVRSALPQAVTSVPLG